MGDHGADRIKKDIFRRSHDVKRAVGRMLSAMRVSPDDAVRLGDLLYNYPMGNVSDEQLLEAMHSIRDSFQSADDDSLPLSLAASGGWLLGLTHVVQQGVLKTSGLDIHSSSYMGIPTWPEGFGEHENGEVEFTGRAVKFGSNEINSPEELIEKLAEAMGPDVPRMPMELANQIFNAKDSNLGGVAAYNDEGGFRVYREEGFDEEEFDN